MLGNQDMLEKSVFPKEFKPRLRLFHRKTSFGKQLIFQITFSGKLTHFPVFGSDLENNWKTFSCVWYAQKNHFPKHIF
jgi:hypothetical protein